MSERHCFFGFLFSGAVLGSAALFPDTLQAVVLAALAVCTLVFFARESERPVRHFFSAGVMFSATAFYWIPDPIQLFGGFPEWLAYLLFALFAATSALQFAAVGWCYRRLRPENAQDEHWLILPILWFAGELLFPRIFPWGVANNFLAWRSFAALAGICGVAPLSFLIFAWAAYAVHIAALARAEGAVRHGRLLWLIAGVSLPVIAGAYRFTLVGDEIRISPRAKIGVIQGNLHAKQGANVLLLTANLDTYDELSKKAQRAGAELLIWPESVMNIWTPTNVKNQSIRGTKYDPFPGGDGRLLYGTMSFQRKPESEIARLREAGALINKDDAYDKYNSALTLEDGRVLGLYHKRVLMPFGEFLPFASTFPRLKRLSPYTGDLSAGDVLTPLVFGENREKQIEELRIGVLICYEDLVPKLSRDYAMLGANLLVNVTNDAWFGVSHAQTQHSMLAAWRAIETGRSLVRDTNTGYSVAIDPSGEEISAIPLYQEGFVVAEVPLLSGRTLYSRIGDSLSWALLLGGGVFLFRLRRRRPLPDGAGR